MSFASTLESFSIYSKVLVVKIQRIYILSRLLANAAEGSYKNELNDNFQTYSSKTDAAYISSSSGGRTQAACRACEPWPSSSEAIKALACCISKIASSQKLTKASSFSLSPPSVTIE